MQLRLRRRRGALCLSGLDLPAGLRLAMRRGKGGGLGARLHNFVLQTLLNSTILRRKEGVCSKTHAR
jgi:hypothetical protein